MIKNKAKTFSCVINGKCRIIRNIYSYTDGFFDADYKGYSITCHFDNNLPVPNAVWLSIKVTTKNKKSLVCEYSRTVSNGIENIEDVIRLALKKARLV